jgi:hypothetical protein
LESRWSPFLFDRGRLSLAARYYFRNNPGNCATFAAILRASNGVFVARCNFLSPSGQ